MSRVVSQEGFNEAVLENKELLDLSLKEAIEETIEQFMTQGVDLTNIIKDPYFINKENPVSSLVCRLKHVSDESEIIDIVTELKSICERGIEYKLLCGKEHVYQALIDKLSSQISLNLQETILEFFTVLMDGYPDVLDEKGCNLLLQMVHKSPTIATNIFKIIDVTCMKHEINRQMYMENNITAVISESLSNEFIKNNVYLCALLSTIPALTRDDDIRSETSKKYTHACSLANELLKPLCHILLDKKIHDPHSLECLLNALSCIIVNNEQCSTVEVEECVPVVIKLIKTHYKNHKVLAKSFWFLFSIAGNDNLNVQIVKQGAAEQIILAMHNFIAQKTMVQILLKLVSRLCLRKPNHGALFFQLNFHSLVIRAMEVHDKIGSVQVAGCWCIRNMSSRNPQHHSDYLAVGAEGVLNKVLSNHEAYAQDAKFALIELHCPVKLDQPWDGKEGDKLKHD